MHKITFPLKLGMQGPDVTNLQDALLLLIDKGIIKPSAADRQAYIDGLSQEQLDQTYKGITIKAVNLFQQQQHFPPPITGEVDGPTADALDQILKDLGAFDTAQNGQKHMVAAQVMQDDQAPFKGTVILFHEGDQGSIRQGEDAYITKGLGTIGTVRFGDKELGPAGALTKQG